MYEKGKDWIRWRKGKSMNMKDFALALGLARRTVQGIESGEHKPSFKSKMLFRELRERHEKNEGGDDAETHSEIPSLQDQIPVHDLLWKAEGKYPAKGSQAYRHNAAVISAYKRGLSQ